MVTTAMTAMTTRNIAMMPTMPLPPVDDGVDTRPITGLPVGAAATSSCQLRDDQVGSIWAGCSRTAIVGSRGTLGSFFPLFVGRGSSLKLVEVCFEPNFNMDQCDVGTG